LIILNVSYIDVDIFDIKEATMSTLLGTGAVMQGRVSALEFLAPYLTELATAVSV